MQISNFSIVNDFLLPKNNVSQVNGTTTTNAYKSSDLVSISSLNNTYPNTKETYNPPVPKEPGLFDKPVVRLAGMSIATGAAGAGIGFGISKMIGSNITKGTAIGAGVGVIIPIALLAYGIYSWNKNS